MKKQETTQPHNSEQSQSGTEHALVSISPKRQPWRLSLHKISLHVFAPAFRCTRTSLYVFSSPATMDQPNNNTDASLADASTQTGPGFTGATNLSSRFPQLRTFRHFFSLPMEIQLMCLEHLCPQCRETDSTGKLAFCLDSVACQRRLALRNFSLASRQCRSLAQPILFHRPQIGVTTRGGGANLGTLLRLVRSMVMRPDLAAEVKTIVLNLRMETYEMPLTMADRDMIKAAGDRLLIPLAGSMSPLTWAHTPVSGPEPTDVNNSVNCMGFRRYASALVVALAFNATTLDILNCAGRLDHEFRSLVLWGNTQLTNQLKLKRLRVEGSRPGCKRSIAEVAPYFRLAPGITDLVVAHPRWFIRPGPAGPDEPAFPVSMFGSLKRLDLFDVQLKTSDFQAAIDCCPRLECLSYLAYRFVYLDPEDPNFVPEWLPVTPREISHILSTSPVRHTLRVLMIECPREVEAWQSPGTIGNLRALTKLQLLVIGGNAVSGNYKSDEAPDWTPEHDPRLFNLLPVGLLRLCIFNVVYCALPLSGQEISALVKTLKEDIDREAELTGVRRPLGCGYVGVGTKDPRFTLMMPSWADVGLSAEDRRLIYWADHFYSFQ